MRNTKLCEEALTVSAQENVEKEQSSRAVKKRMLALRDVPREVRKREASEPLYLIRYE